MVVTTFDIQSMHTHTPPHYHSQYYHRYYRLRQHLWFYWRAAWWRPCYLACYDVNAIPTRSRSIKPYGHHISGRVSNCKFISPSPPRMRKVYAATATAHPAALKHRSISGMHRPISSPVATFEQSENVAIAHLISYLLWGVWPLQLLPSAHAHGTNGQSCPGRILFVHELLIMSLCFVSMYC